MTAVTNWLNLNVFKQYSLLLFCSGGQKANNGSQWTKTKVWTELCASGGSREESLPLVPPVSRGAHIPHLGPHPGISSLLPLLPPSHTLSGSSLSLLRIRCWLYPPSWTIRDHLPSQTLLPQISCSQLWVVQLAHLWEGPYSACYSEAHRHLSCSLMLM